MSYLTPPPLIDKPVHPDIAYAKPLNPIVVLVTLALPSVILGTLGIGLSFVSFWIAPRLGGIWQTLFRNPYLLYGLPPLFLTGGFLFGVQSLTILGKKHKLEL